MADLSLESLSRRELQVLAKQYGIKANLKNADIIKQVSLARANTAASEGAAAVVVAECDEQPDEDTQDREPSTKGRSEEDANVRPRTDLEEAADLNEDSDGITVKEEECCASPATPPTLTIPSHLDLRLESSKVISQIHTEEKCWIDSAKKELVHLEHCWDQVINSPIRKYGCPSSSDKKKTTLSLLHSGFTSVVTPAPLRKFRRRERGNQHEEIIRLSSGQKQLADGDKNTENERREEVPKKGKRSTKEKENRLGIKSRLSKSSKSQVKKSRRMALAEEKFKSRLLKRKN